MENHSVVMEIRMFYLKIFPPLNHVTDDQSGLPLLVRSRWKVCHRFCYSQGLHGDQTVPVQMVYGSTVVLCRARLWAHTWEAGWGGGAAAAHGLSPRFLVHVIQWEILAFSPVIASWWISYFIVRLVLSVQSRLYVRCEVRPAKALTAQVEKKCQLTDHLTQLKRSTRRSSHS